MTEQYRILVADDEASIVDIIKTALISAGYAVVTAQNGEDACRLLAETKPHLIIMDVMMPRCNGIVATARIRSDSHVPILMLSAKAEGDDRVLGLESGADDYLVKPFYTGELMARVRALLRRYDDLGSIREDRSPSAITVGDATLDTEQKTLTMRGERVRLTATEYKILEVMMSNPGRVFSAEQLYSRVWDSEAYAVENTVMVHIRRIREKIELDPKRPEYLRVKWGIGYVFGKE